MVCPKCGKQYNDTAKFCPKCGCLLLSNNQNNQNVNNINIIKNDNINKSTIIATNTKKQNKKINAMYILIFILPILVIGIVLKSFVFNKNITSDFESQKGSPKISVEESSESSDINTTTAVTEYVFPDSDKRLLTIEEVILIDDVLLRIAIDEIYARHGRIFKDKDLNDYFTSKSWYHGIYGADNFDESCFSDIEWYNIDLLSKVRDSRQNGY